MPRTLVNRRWDTVNEGDELPELSFGPITISNLMRDAAGTKDYYQIHHDREFAKGNGARDAFLNTMWYQGFLGRYVTEWGGHESMLRRLTFHMRRPSCLGDTITARGRVLKKYEQDGKKLVDLDVHIDNSVEGPNSVPASATVEFAE